MRCEACGLEIPPGSSFCNHCGATLNDQGKMQKVAATPPAPPPSTADVSPAPQPPPSPGFTPPPASNQPEQALWEDYPSLRTAIPFQVTSLLLCIIVIIVEQALFSEKWEARGFAIGLTMTVLGILWLVLVARDLVRLRSISYKLTTQRLFVTRGILNKRTDELELEQYKDIFVKQDFLDKMFGCGDIQVVTTDEANGSVEIRDVMDPVRKKEMIRNAARDRKQALGIIRREEL